MRTREINRDRNSSPLFNHSLLGSIKILLKLPTLIVLQALIAAMAMVWNEPLRANYSSAKQSFDRKDYVNAASAFFAAYQSPKNREEKLKSEWGIAQSLERLGLLYSASQFYSRIVIRGPQNGQNDFFSPAMDQLGKINRKLSLGQAHIVQLFRENIKSEDVPRGARGFYFYYLGIEAFGKKQLEKAGDRFRLVPSESAYYTGALFHLAVIKNLSGSHGEAINYFEKVISSARDGDSEDEIRQAAIMNVARVNYEEQRYTTAIRYYGQIPRNSEHWLDAQWEASWAFFFMQKFNNTLGNIHTIHSPFFINRFYPESYILQAITFLRMCRFDQVRESMRRFKQRYEPVFVDVKAMLTRYDKDYSGFFKLLYDYKNGNSRKYENAEEILKKLSTIDSYKEARDSVRFSDRELDALNPYKRKWSGSGLLENLESFLQNKKTASVRDAGRRLYDFATTFYSQLLELSGQTKLIVAEMQLGKIDDLRSKISVNSQKQKVEYIGGMQELNLRQELEYWPFEQEYWEDELGYYVYNMPSKCVDRAANKDGSSSEGSK